MASSHQQSRRLVSGRELQGQRPSPLMVNKGSRKIKKAHHVAPLPPSVPYRPPVIIYTRSPKVIHAKAHDFMTLVQRLTGSSSSSSSLSSSSSSSSSSSYSSSYSSSSSSSFSSNSLLFSSYNNQYGPNGHTPLSNFDLDQVQDPGIEVRGNPFPPTQETICPVSPSPTPISPCLLQPSPSANPSFHDFNSTLYTPCFEDGFLISPPMFNSNKPLDSNSMTLYSDSPSPSLDFFDHLYLP
ncbi:hypothetical protein AMTRI_Chr03g149490 [Amborella trichopoda]|uniref:VQ domain-containing protein n=1 Tax=Amborella trichopoda TaxID=13333 RepID=W1NE45_AMBTC|nr:putative protein TPRXL [Amborella trichopoda]ERM93643.1 hypothetical protein AMTR_s00004p00151900 [Amborella trichopoda]|eukprot:XP_006826406.1 putative protein TPRXL [Amborella trichopoda]